MKSINIQLYSDFHLELNEKAYPKIKPYCDYLFLAGDIGKINTPNFKEMEKIWWTNRRSQYAKYYDMFKSHIPNNEYYRRAVSNRII